MLLKQDLKGLSQTQLKEHLEAAYARFNCPAFIPDDPISIPHQFETLADREIIGFWTAILSWGNRQTIINKARELCAYMDYSPLDFVLNHQDSDLKRICQFKHRTFNATDTLYFIHFFKQHYTHFDSLEDGFLWGYKPELNYIEGALSHFHDYFCSLDAFPERTRKHIASPSRNSACKRINMFLRWMVRQDSEGVDFGVWQRISPEHLICPCDVHVERVGRQLGLIQTKSRGWKMAQELTENLKKLDAHDPVRYDFALFGLGVLEKNPSWGQKI